MKHMLFALELCAGGAAQIAALIPWGSFPLSFSHQQKTGHAARKRRFEGGQF
jgi:hypothetical protein